MREYFLKNSQIVVLISSSKFIKTERLLNNKRGKKNLMYGENFIYSTLNKQGVHTGDVLNIEGRIVLPWLKLS